MGAAEDENPTDNTINGTVGNGGEDPRFDTTDSESRATPNGPPEAVQEDGHTASGDAPLEAKENTESRSERDSGENSNKSDLTVSPNTGHRYSNLSEESVDRISRGSELFSSGMGDLKIGEYEAVAPVEDMEGGGAENGGNVATEGSDEEGELRDSDSDPPDGVKHHPTSAILDRKSSWLSLLERTGKLATAKALLDQVDEDELEKVKQGTGIFYNYRKQKNREEDLVAVVETQLKLPASKKCWMGFQATRRAIHRIFDEPGSSWLAKLVNFFVLFWIVLSTITFILESMPELRDEEDIFFVIECFVVVIFTAEYFIRLVTAPQPWKFPFRIMNIIDILAILPFYLDLIILAVTAASGEAESGGAGSAFRVLRTVRLVRVFRVFKLGRHSTSMKIFMQTLRKSMDALILLAFYLVIAIIVFSSLIYFLERGDWDDDRGGYFVIDADGNYVQTLYTSIPASAYWTVTTITSVGYGDVVPFSNGGRTVGVLAMVFGILVMSFPISVIGTQFSDMWVEKTMEKHFKKLEDEKEEKEKKKKKQLLKELKRKKQLAKNKVAPENGEEEEEDEDEEEPTVPPDPVDEVFRLLRLKALDFEYQKLLFEDLAEKISYKLTKKREMSATSKLKQGPALYLVVDLMSIDIGRKIESAMLSTLRIRKILDSLTWTVFDPHAIDIEKELLTRDAAAAIVRWQEWKAKKEKSQPEGEEELEVEEEVPVKTGGRLKALSKPVLMMQRSIFAKASDKQKNKRRKEHEALGLRSVLGGLKKNTQKKGVRVSFADASRASSRRPSPRAESLGSSEKGDIQVPAVVEMQGMTSSGDKDGAEAAPSVVPPDVEVVPER